MRAREWVLEREAELLAQKLSLAEATINLLRQEIQLLEARVAAQKDDIERLLAHNQELASRPVPERSSVPLYMSEAEEDIRYQQDAGIIRAADAEDMLRQLDFENSEIVFDSDDNFIF